MIEGTFPTGRVDPIGVAPAEVVAQAVRCELLEAVAEAAAEYRRFQRSLASPPPFLMTPAQLDEARCALDAALVAAGATGKAGT